MAMMSDGIKGERLARIKLRKHGATCCMQPDLCAKENGVWIIVEAKYKKMYKIKKDGYDFIGTGLSTKQISARLQWFHDTGIRCKLISFNKLSDKENFLNGTNAVECFEGWLDELEASGDYVERPIPNSSEIVHIYNQDVMNKSTLLYMDQELIHMSK